MDFYFHRGEQILGGIKVLDEFKQDAFTLKLLERESDYDLLKYNFKNWKGALVATAEQEQFMFPTHMIRVNGVRFGRLKKISTRGWKKKYLVDILDPHDYEIEGSFVGMDCEIKRNKQVVATVKKENISQPQLYKISFGKKEENVIPLLVAILIIFRRG